YQSSNGTSNNHFFGKHQGNIFSLESGLSVLRSKVAFNAMHDSEARYPQPNVMPGTREEIMRRLSQWIEDPDK
ncbi:hypothetical protein L218DRAFT_819632, partial [Marasmius fiardii PR-910]